MPVVFEDAHLQVIHAPGESGYALATFNTRDTRANGRVFFAQPLHQKYGVECFGFVSRAANWYPHPSMAAAAAAIAPLRRAPLIGYGHSQGGYAALKYSRLLGLAGAVASGPQVSIDPAEGLADRRFTHHFDPALHQGMRIVAEDLAGRLVLVYDPAYPPDVEHAEAIRALSPAVEPLHLSHLNHRTVVALSPSTVLLPLFTAILEGSPLAPVALAARQARRRHPQYAVYLARAALVRRRPLVAQRLLEPWRPEELKPPLAKERNLLLARAYARQRRHEEALRLYDVLLRDHPSVEIYAREAERSRQAVARRQKL
ncbi:hypothetical protein NON00_09260 [Roseomonas sp. GC11]|uniref:hypothetical protein n=1 Tax=Roseomonas sp. GC11 TaxID=2950546 RepID=UPI00210EFFF1|nr:hypothetical protein [Roseomonas sp. GC11]MCQ4160117.1 hypothetical protein [Roseomonas sp. GC11]